LAKEPESRAAAAAKEAAGAAVAAGQDALRALELLVTDPVGKIGEACASLGDQRAMAAGIVFAVVFDLCYLLFPFAPFFGMGPGAPEGARRFLVPLTAGALLFLGLALGSLVARVIFKGQGSFRRDLFVAGVTLLPMAALVLFQKTFSDFPRVCALAYPFALSFTVLLLYSACTEMHRISRRAASVAVPVIILMGMFLASAAQRIFGSGG
jgi:hypothetical protein